MRFSAAKAGPCTPSKAPNSTVHMTRIRNLYFKIALQGDKCVNIRDTGRQRAHRGLLRMDLSPLVVVMPMTAPAMLPFLAPMIIAMAPAPTTIVVVVAWLDPDLAALLARAPRRVDPPTSWDPISSFKRRVSLGGRRRESRRGACGTGGNHARKHESRDELV